MRKISLVGFLLTLMLAKAFPQATDGRVFQLNKLSKQDTLLSGWKFHAGDDPQWANPTFDDSKWQPTDPGQDITHFEQLKNSGIGWIRLHIVADSSLTKQQLGAWVYQLTASEIYLNGRLIEKYGSISADKAKTIASCPAVQIFNLKLQPGTDQVIAVRMAYQPGFPYISTTFVPPPAFSMYVNTYQVALENQQRNEVTIKLVLVNFALLTGIFLILSIVHLFYFVFDRQQKVNLYYFIFSTALWIGAGLSTWFYNNIDEVATQMWVLFMDSVCFIIIYLFLTLTVYSLFNYQSRFVLRALALLGAFGVIYQFWNGVFGYILCTNIFSILGLIEGARICIWAIMRQKKDAALILIGILLCIVFIVWSSFLDQTAVFTMVLFTLSFASFPVGMSFYLGLQSALTNRKLKFTLAEVQELSQQTLIQEQEKQQILASQNERLEEQVNERTAALNQSLVHLKQTQNQLIQSEKMASLGELTAGVAHEIQNPLNFVNNFSEVSIELLGELKDEAKAGNTNEVISIADDLSQNLEKINHHGKRADFIVKGMLEHSRVTKGERQLSHINVLAAEFLKLSYTALRTKDKNFTADIITNFKTDLPKINVVTQDIGRVLLNIFNNAFYAVNQKLKVIGDDFKPVVSISTDSNAEQVIIKIRDNGIGIPDLIKDKIMQPFFTTKPTGEGTGLGLSITYDMVVKGHGGTIAVDAKEGEFTEFTVTLPFLS